MPAIKKISVCRYRDNGQVTAEVEWVDGSTTSGNLEYTRSRPHYPMVNTPTFGMHMHALFARARREGLHTELRTLGF